MNCLATIVLVAFPLLLVLLILLLVFLVLNLVQHAKTSNVHIPNTSMLGSRPSSSTDRFVREHKH